MCVKIADFRRRNSGIGECEFHYTPHSLATLQRSVRVIRVGVTRVADQLGNRLDSATECVLTFLDYKNSSTLSEDKSVAIACFGIHIETRTSNREFGGGQGKLNEPGGFLDILFPHEIEGIKTGKLPSNPAGQGSCVEERNGADSRTASQDTLPGTLGTDSGRAEKPNPSYDDATPLAHPFHPPTLLSIA